MNSLLMDAKVTRLTHEVLETLMAVVTSIINARPVTGIFEDPQEPSPLSSANMLTLNTTHTVDSRSFPRKIYTKTNGVVYSTFQIAFVRNGKWNIHLHFQKKKWQRDKKSGTTRCIRNDWSIGK